MRDSKRILQIARGTLATDNPQLDDGMNLSDVLWGGDPDAERRAMNREIVRRGEYANCRWEDHKVGRKPKFA